MALTFTKFIPDSIPLPGNRVVWLGSVTFDSSYPTGGEAIAASDFGLDKILFVQLNSDSNVAGKYIVWDRTNSKLLIYDEDDTSGIAAEAGNGSNQSAVVVQVTLWGEDTTP